MTAARAQYRFAPARYIRERLGWEPWTGTSEQPGQRQILDAYTLALRQQHERDAYEKGELAEDGLTCWQPGQTIRNWIRVAAGHTTGKTKVSAGIVSHFFDNFPRSITYTYAPTWDQIKHLLWKEIGVDRAGKNLPGNLLKTCVLKTSEDHFALGKAAEKGKTESVQGQHGPYNLHIVDEAEGVDDVVMDALPSMTSGGISIVLLLANPRTRTSRFHRIAAQSNVVSFRMSCLHHPNVRAGREIVPGAVRRQYVEEMLEKHTATVDAHDADSHTFTVPWREGVIYLPDAEFMFRVLGVAPANISDKCLIPVGRFEAACKRKPVSDRPDFASIGVDCARWGLDVGTVYTRHDGAVWLEKELRQQETGEYVFAVTAAAQRLAAKGVKRLHIRVDAGGGFGGGLVDTVRRDESLRKLFAEFKVFEVSFGAGGEAVHDQKAWANVITELTADVGESLKGLAVINPHESLEQDLCERETEPANIQGRFVRRLEEKDKFRKRHHRSPDHGDGFVLASASEFLFASGIAVAPASLGASSKWRLG